MYETNGILNKATGNELVKVSMNRKYKRLLQIWALVCLLLSIISVIFWTLSSMKIFLKYATLPIYGILFLFFAYRVFLARTKTVYVDSMEEISNKGEFEFRVFFNENGVNISNLTTSANIEIKYEFFSRLEETPNMYVLFTKCGHFALIFKKDLSNEEIRSFKGFIREKCKNIK